MDILRQSLQKQNLNTMQTTRSTWVAENKATGEKTIQKFNSTTKQTELEDIILKEMIRKFEKVNKSV